MFWSGIYAEHDNLVPPEEHLSCFAKCGEQKKLVKLPKAGHYDSYEFRNTVTCQIVYAETIAWFKTTPGRVAMIALLAAPCIASAQDYPSFPPQSVPELLALARAKPGQINYASTGTRSAQHFVGEMVKAYAKIDMIHISYQSIAKTLAADGADLRGNTPEQFRDFLVREIAKYQELARDMGALKLIERRC